jgi:NAD+ synthase (glutamine-hydrolysing)
MTVKVALAQINSTLGDLAANAAKILDFARRAHAGGADIVLTPELSLTGYPPEDLLLRPAFYAKTAHTLQTLQSELAQLPGLHVVVGHPWQENGQNFNAASVLVDGQLLGTYCKHDLPNDAVFDEMRYFVGRDQALVFALKGIRFALAICEDTWYPHVPQQARAAGADVLLVPNGSPFHMQKQDLRLDVMRANVSTQGLALVYANLVGGQDELIFDGASFALDASGALCLQMPQFVEDMQYLEVMPGLSEAGEGAAKDLAAGAAATPQVQLKPGVLAAPMSLDAQVYQALVLGVRDYLGKNGFPGAIIGMSGGVDSALTLAIAVDALGAEQVRAVMMPSPYTADISWLDSREMVQRLGVRYDEIPIHDCFQAFRQTLAQEFAGLKEDATEENLQARIRGTILMALSNKHGSIVLTTGNKSEMAVGYCTLYGDMAGGFAVIKDIAKTLVYRLCDYRNGVSDVIPQRILTRAPSAELRPDQLDQDSLPPYEVLDAIMQMYMEQNRPIVEILAAGYKSEDVARVTRLIKLNEYKRRQAPVGIRVTHRSFGRDWRYPITSRFSE